MGVDSTGPDHASPVTRHGALCPKCHGFVQCDCHEARCLNCGYRPGDLNRPIGTEREEGPRKCHNCKRMAEAGKKTCAHCLGVMARRRHAQRQAGTGRFVEAS